MPQVLTFLKNFHKSMHCSFGDKANAQLPHLVCPLWQSADRMFVTRPGEEPPTLGQNIPETDAARSARRSGPPRGDFDPDNIYTFTLNTSIVDLPNWQVSMRDLTHSSTFLIWQLAHPPSSYGNSLIHLPYMATRPSTWQIVDVPMMRAPLNLATFVGDSSNFRFVVYTNPATVSSKEHLAASNRHSTVSESRRTGTAQ